MNATGTLLIALVMVAITSSNTSLCGEPKVGPFLNNGVTAHRGNSGEHPENTIPAFKSGIEVGADWLELDIFRTKDGKLVVIHDRTTERVGDKNLLVADSNGVLSCLDGQIGEEHYRERLGGDCNSSPIASDGRIYLSNNDGTTFVVQAGKNFELLSRNELGERITASPAISGNELIYRTDSHLYCIGQDR